MILYGYLFFIAASAVFALQDWRRAGYLLILTGVLQDPVRKIIPGAPAYLVLATVPVWGAMVVAGVLGHWGAAWSAFRRCYPFLAASMTAFLACLALPALISVSYGPGAWQLAVIGGLSYLIPLAGFVTGFWYPRRQETARRLVIFYCVVTAILLIGTPLEYLGIGKGSPLIGADALGHRWVRHIPGVQVTMIAGFYRSPDVMGWHAAVLSMLAVCLALSARGVWSLVWAATSGWGMVGIMLCGRRKMFLMLPVFLGVLGVFYLYGSRRSVRRFREFVIPAAVAVLVGIFLYERVFPSETVGAYYFQYRGDPIAERMKSQGFVAVVETYRQAGFLGAGLGTATQGTQHIQCERPRTWQESGLSRIMVELGVPGLVAFSFIGFALLAACARLLRAMNPRLPDYGFSSGLASMLLANGGSYMVSHQVFGDPFVASLMSFFVGLLLSRGRLYFLPPPPERPAPVPPRRDGSGLERQP